MRTKRFLLGAGLAALGLLPLLALAQPGIPAFTTSPAPGGGTAYSLPVQTLILLTAMQSLDRLARNALFGGAPGGVGGYLGGNTRVTTTLGSASTSIHGP